MTTRIAFLGDTLPGGEGQDVLATHGYAHAFAGIAPLLKSADLVVANLEGPATHRDEPAGKSDTGRKRYWYRALPESLHAMSDAGIRVVSLGNNHVLDFGPDGLRETLQALDAAGIAYCGAGSNEEQARQPAIMTIGDCTIGFLSVMQRYDIYVREKLYASRKRPGPFRLREKKIGHDLATLKERVDVVVALVHWGRNYRPVTARQRRIAATLAGGGADLVIGHHPHVPHPVANVNNVPVFYSLGNGPLGTPGRYHSGRPPFGLVVTIEMEQKKISRAGLSLIEVDNSQVRFCPRPAEPSLAIPFLRTLVSPTEGWHIDTSHDEGGQLWITR